MKQKYQHFLTRLTYLTILLALLAWSLTVLFPAGVVSTAFPWILLLFLATTALVHYVLLKITALNPRRFISYFMLATFIKLILYFTAVLIFLFTHREQALSFIVTFMIIYIVYTMFEVVFILKQTRDG